MPLSSLVTHGASTTKRLGPLGGPAVPTERVERFTVRPAGDRVVFPAACAWCGVAPATGTRVVVAPLRGRSLGPGAVELTRRTVEAPCCEQCLDYLRKRPARRFVAAVAAVLGCLAAFGALIVLLTLPLLVLADAAPRELGVRSAIVLGTAAVAGFWWWVRGQAVASLRLHPAPAEPVVELAADGSLHIFDGGYARELCKLNGSGEPRGVWVARLPTSLSQSRYHRLAKLNPPKDRSGPVAVR